MLPVVHLEPYNQLPSALSCVSLERLPFPSSQGAGAGWRDQLITPLGALIGTVLFLSSTFSAVLQFQTRFTILAVFALLIHWNP